MTHRLPKLIKILLFYASTTCFWSFGTNDCVVLNVRKYISNSFRIRECMYGKFVSESLKTWKKNKLLTSLKYVVLLVFCTGFFCHFEAAGWSTLGRIYPPSGLKITKNLVQNTNKQHIKVDKIYFKLGSYLHVFGESTNFAYILIYRTCYLCII